MAIDSEAKRKSVASMTASMPVAIAPDNTQPQGWRQTAGWGYYGINASIVETTPADDDADTARTAYTDSDGATMLAPRLTVLHATDSLRNSALGGPSRLPLDMYEAKSDRYGQGTQEGDVLRLFSYAHRAGEAYAARFIEVEFDFVPSTTLLTTDTTGGTDADGASVLVGTINVKLGMDSLRNADLELGAAAIQDAHSFRLLAPDNLAVGMFPRVMWHENGRAGSSASIAFIEVEYDLVGPELVRAAVT